MKKVTSKNACCDIFKHETDNIKPDINLIFGKSADNLEVNTFPVEHC